MDSSQSIFFESFPLQPRKGDLRKFAILEAVISCVARDGAVGATPAHIANHLKIRRSHVIYYFKDTQALVRGAFQLVTAVAQKTTIEAVKTAETPLDKILAISDGAFNWADKYPDQVKFLLFFYYLCTHDPHFAKLNAQIRETGFQRTKALLETAFAGHKTPLKYEDLAKMLQAIPTGLIIEQFSTGGASGRAACRMACLEWMKANFKK